MDNLELLQKITDAIKELRTKGKAVDELDLWLKIAPYLDTDEQDKLFQSLSAELVFLNN